MLLRWRLHKNFTKSLVLIRGRLKKWFWALHVKAILHHSLHWSSLDLCESMFLTVPTSVLSVAHFRASSIARKAFFSFFKSTKMQRFGIQDQVFSKREEKVSRPHWSTNLCRWFYIIEEIRPPTKPPVAAASSTRSNKNSWTAPKWEWWIGKGIKHGVKGKDKSSTKFWREERSRISGCLQIVRFPHRLKFWS